MKNRKYLMLLILFFISCSIKKKKKFENELDFKMVEYESKAYIDSTEFPIIKLFGDNYYQVYIKDILVDEGSVIKNVDTFTFKINNAAFMTKMSGYFLNQSKNAIRVYNLFAIGVEANYGDFVKIN
jgi:hypothetical protein